MSRIISLKPLFSLLASKFVVVAMVTYMEKYPKWYTLCQLVPLPLKGTLCHLVSGVGTKSQNDTK